jgi:hypothetical protein
MAPAAGVREHSNAESRCDLREKRLGGFRRVEDVGQSGSDDGDIGSDRPPKPALDVVRWPVERGHRGASPRPGRALRALRAVRARALGAIGTFLIGVDMRDRLGGAPERQDQE